MFIVVEGKDGVGKGTQVRLLIEWLKSLGFDVWETREPTDGPYGRKIRRIRDGREPMPEATKFQLLYVYDRAQHMFELAEPLLAKKMVVCDRYDYSTEAYGEAGGADMTVLLKAGEGFVRPDIALWLNLDSGSARARMEERGKMDVLDEDLDFQDRLQSAYLKLLVKYPELKEIDASGTPEEVHQRIREEVEKILPKAE